MDKCKISVCMASYNGSSFIEQQLSSILRQLSSDDEVIIVDDHSTDSTVDIIRKFRDPRIKLFHNGANLGPVRSFERALTNAGGNLIFLSDQDDLWSEKKVERFKAYFRDHPEVSVALSDAAVIDGEGHLLSRSWTGSRKFTPSLTRNLVKNTFLGCVMVFRRELLTYVLPFPARLPMHDMWIGMVNELFGKAGYLDETLVSYRRHGGNATGKRGRIDQMLRWRWTLIKGLFLRWTMVKLRTRRAKSHDTLLLTP